MYRRRYRVTLAPTERNFREALEVWRVGILTHRGIVSAIIQVYGYRYRRMENFIRECQLWKEGEGWLHSKVLTKLYFDYVGKPENTFSIEFFIIHLLPEFLIGEHDIEKGEGLTYDLLELFGWDWTRFIGSFRMGDDEKLHGWGYLYCCTQTVDVRAIFWKYKHHRWIEYDRGEAEAELANYILHRTKLCEEVRDWTV